MNCRKIALLAALSAGVPVFAAQAQTTTFQSKQLLIAGDDNVQARGINDSGVIVGTVFAGITSAPTGFSLLGNKVTLLPAPNAGFPAFYPVAINAAGDIFGWGRNPIDDVGDTFLYQKGAYNPAYQQLLIAPSDIAPYIVPQFLGLTKTDEIFFNVIFSLSGPVGTNYGTPPHLQEVPMMERFTNIMSINNAGTIAGTTFSFNGVRAMFEGKNKHFTAVLPPGSTNTKGGYLNNKGAIAGSYVDGSRAYHGFVYQAGTYTSFDMPEAASDIEVTGINDLGRVVGYYKSVANQHLHAFLYNGTTVSKFGSFDQSNDVNVVINNYGVMVVMTMFFTHDPKYLSYRVICSGPGC